MKVVLAGLLGMAGLFATFLGAVWALFMHKLGEPLDPTGPYLLDYLVLAALTTFGLSLLRVSHTLTTPWHPALVWLFGAVVAGLVLVLVWADTPLSSCAYLPVSPSKCESPIHTA